MPEIAKFAGSMGNLRIMDRLKIYVLAAPEIEA
jgi:hypothetical protein